jgi:MutS domain V
MSGFAPGLKIRSGVCVIANETQTGSMTGADPATEYERRLATHSVAARQLGDRERLAGRCRIAAFMAIVVVFFLARPSELVFLVWVAPPVVAFLVAIAWHRRTVQALTRTRLAARYFNRGLERLHDRWVGRGPTGDRYADPHHPYSGDLDLFGRGSLFQYVCDAHTPAGQDALADWLLNAADVDTVQKRQQAVAELRPNVDLRESLGTLGEPEKSELKTRHLLTWPAAAPIFTGRAGPLVAIGLCILGIVGVILWAAFETGPSPLLLVVMIEAIVIGRMWGRIQEVMRDSRAVLAELEAFLPVLRLLEAQQFQSSYLRSVSETLTCDGEPPSRRVARLAGLLDAWDTAIRNQFTLPFAIVLMLPAHLVYAVERWRLRDGRRVHDWLDAVGKFEATASLSAFGFEQPTFPFAEVTAAGPVIEAEGLGHPLVAGSRRVPNDLRLGLEPALLLVSGSNMSGKSTLMRAVGVNVVLALAGAPVCARRLRVSPVQVATAMRQGDSLQDGLSAFAAELKRLREIRDLTEKPRPILFLLDEFLRGTNSHDRRVGAEAVILALLKTPAVGMVSTHDLALAEIVDRLGSRAANVHFEDQIADGRVSFDYRLRPGVVPRGNGLVLLRLLGFEV